MEQLVAYLLAFFLAAVPPSSHREAETEVVARYGDLAEAIAEAALNPYAAPPIAGPDGRERTALVLAAIAVSESTLRADVDACRVTGDDGRARTAFQLHGAPREACHDRRLAARIALDRVAASMRACRHVAAPERLALYTSGSCSRGRAEARSRWRRAAAWWRLRPGGISVQ